MQAQPDDKEVIELVLRGEQAAYSLLVARYQAYVFTLVMRYVKDRETAEELAQDVFVKAYRCLADFKGCSKFSTWLYTIVNTTCLSYMRKQKAVTVLLEEERMVSVAGGATGGPDQRLEHNSQKQMLESAMKQLPEQDAQVLSLYYQAEQTIEEAGMIMGLTPGNVKVKLHRARQKLKEVLEREYKRDLT